MLPGSVKRPYRETTAAVAGNSAEQGVERDACRNEQDAIVLHPAIEAPGDVLPTLRRYLGGLFGHSASAARRRVADTFECALHAFRLLTE